MYDKFWFSFIASGARFLGLEAAKRPTKSHKDLLKVIGKPFNSSQAWNYLSLYNIVIPIINSVIILWPEAIHVVLINFAVVFGLHGFYIYIYLLVKVARPIVCVGTPSIFESLILKEIDLYCKNFITNVIHIDLTLLLFYFFGDRNKYHVTKTSQ